MQVPVFLAAIAMTVVLPDGKAESHVRRIVSHDRVACVAHYNNMKRGALTQPYRGAALTFPWAEVKNQKDYQRLCEDTPEIRGYKAKPCEVVSLKFTP